MIVRYEFKQQNKLINKYIKGFQYKGFFNYPIQLRYSMVIHYIWFIHLHYPLNLPSNIPIIVRLVSLYVFHRSSILLLDLLKSRTQIPSSFIPWNQISWGCNSMKILWALVLQKQSWIYEEMSIQRMNHLHHSFASLEHIHPNI